MLRLRLFSFYSRVILAVLDGSCRLRISAKVARHSLWEPSISLAGPDHARKSYYISRADADLLEQRGGLDDTPHAQQPAWQ